MAFEKGPLEKHLPKLYATSYSHETVQNVNTLLHEKILKVSCVYVIKCRNDSYTFSIYGLLYFVSVAGQSFGTVEKEG